MNTPHDRLRQAPFPPLAPPRTLNRVGPPESPTDLILPRPRADDREMSTSSLHPRPRSGFLATTIGQARPRSSRSYVLATLRALHPDPAHRPDHQQPRSGSHRINKNT